jgi:hypothetical protein
MPVMDDLDAKLEQERAQLVDLFNNLRYGLSHLSVERLADVLPILTAPCAEVERVARRVGVLRGDPQGGGSLTGPLSGASILP